MKKIIMGNDEFILYIRKQNKQCTKDTQTLGRMIWEQILSLDPNAKQTEKDVQCLWGDIATNVDAYGLPKTATQFEFDRNILPSLYNYLDTI